MEQIDYDIDEFMNYCTSKNLSTKTIGSYEQTLRLLAHYLKEKHKVKSARDTKELHIREYIKYLQERGKYTVVNNQNSKIINFPENREDYGKKIETTTINNYIRSIKVFYNYLYENRYITTNPVVRIKEIKCVRKVIGFIDDSNFNRLLKIFDLSKFHEYRDYIVAQLIFDTGMRLGETLLIEETDIDFTKRTILLKAENTKWKKDRYVFFSQEMLKQLRRWLQYKDRYRQSRYVFCTNKGKSLKVTNYGNMVKEWYEKSNVIYFFYWDLMKNLLKLY